MVWRCTYIWKKILRSRQFKYNYIYGVNVQKTYFCANLFITFFLSIFGVQYRKSKKLKRLHFYLATIEKKTFLILKKTRVQSLFIPKTFIIKISRKRKTVSYIRGGIIIFQKLLKSCVPIKTLYSMYKCITFWIFGSKNSTLLHLPKA